MKNSNWDVDPKKDAAIWASKSMRGKILTRGSEHGFAWIETEAAVIYSCYISPNSSRGQFEDFLGRLEASVEKWHQRKLVIVAGDFNAAPVEWESAATNTRGYTLCLA